MGEVFTRGAAWPQGQNCPRCGKHMRPGCEGRGGVIVAWTEWCPCCGVEIRAPREGARD